MKTFQLLPALAFLCMANTFAAEPPAAVPARADGIRQWMIPDHAPPPAEQRGKPYKVPATNWDTRPILWGWSCELPDGSGLQFGGVNQLSDDGCGHTCIREAGQWKPIVDELRKANPLQRNYHAVRTLRDGCKDALARARSLYFEGREADEELRRITADVDPALAEVAAKLAEQIAGLKGLSGLEAYEASQVKFALVHLAAAAELIKPVATRVDPQLMAGFRNGQIELEVASEFLDAEPPPRALSFIAWDAKTRLYVIFGGDHTDYLTNDLWVFDPANRKWRQRHPALSPEPRADHHLDASGDGRLALYGGYARPQGYAHVGPAHWIYDLEKNIWTADGHDEKLVATGLRSAGYAPPGLPESFMKGPRPAAAEHEAMLSAIPANTWVHLATPIPLGSRDWGTWAFDPDRDLWYVYAGGHASYAGSDVARYHLSTGRWEISDPTELPLGGAGSNEQYPGGVNFNRRPWCRKHVWNSQAYDPALRKLINVGVTDAKLDRFFYTYDPDKSDWTGRHPVPGGMANSCSAIQIRATPHGLFGWSGDTAWLLDPGAMQWTRLAVTGKMPHTDVDSCGMAYDAKRDRMLLMTLGGYAKPYDGQIHALDMKTHAILPLNPQGMNTSTSWRIFLREPAFDPGTDLMIIPQLLDHRGKTLPEQTLAYDAAGNRWILIETPGATARPFARDSVCQSLAYDPKRRLFWLGDAAWNGGIFVLRLDAAAARIKPLALE